jgi:hypothetical protein
VGKLNLQLVTNEEKQDRTQRGENDASWMKSVIGGPRKQVGDSAADDRFLKGLKILRDTKDSMTKLVGALT